MSAPATPASIAEATELLEQVADLEGQIATVEAERQHAIASVNARSDVAANDLMARRAELVSALDRWWSANAAQLTGGKRKSIELGGCVIGSRGGRVSLTVDGDERAVAKSLVKRSWAAGLLRVTISLDKAAVLKALAGEHRRKLQGLGLKRKAGEETFFVERVEQAGTLAQLG